MGQFQLLCRCGILGQSIEQELLDRFEVVTSLPADHFNEDENYEGAIAHLMEVKRWFVHMKAIAVPMHVLMLLGADIPKHKFKRGDLFRILDKKESIDEVCPEDDLDILALAERHAGEICRGVGHEEDNPELYRVSISTTARITLRQRTEHLSAWRMQKYSGGDAEARDK